MCGRTVLSLNIQQVLYACAYKPKGKDLYEIPSLFPVHNDGKYFKPSYNIAPTDVTPVLVANSRLKHMLSNERLLIPMMWGIIPSWHKGDHKSHGFVSTINCRYETVSTSKLYGPILMNGGRCVIIVEGYYGWKPAQKGVPKQPYYIYLPQDDEIMIDNPSTWNNKYSDEKGWSGVKLLYMAGIYNVWSDGDNVIYSYSIMTMSSPDDLKWLHHRTPIILKSQEQVDIWLDVDNINADMAMGYLQPVEILSWYPVSTAVNNTHNKSDVCNKRKREDYFPNRIIFWYNPEKRKSSEETTSSSKIPKTN